MTNYDFDAEALHEYEEAVVFYEQRREGLGARFVMALERAVEGAMAMPNAGSPWPCAPSSLAIRRRQIPGFPALFIAYVALPDRLRIMAVVHGSRRPAIGSIGSPSSISSHLAHSRSVPLSKCQVRREWESGGKPSGVDFGFIERAIVARQKWDCSVSEPSDENAPSTTNPRLRFLLQPIR